MVDAFLGFELFSSPRHVPFFYMISSPIGIVDTLIPFPRINDFAIVAVRMNRQLMNVQVDGMTGFLKTVSGNSQTRIENWQLLFVVKPNRPFVRGPPKLPLRKGEAPTATPPVAARNGSFQFLVAGPREVEIMRLKRFVFHFFFRL